MILTPDNYYSFESDSEYMSVSQYESWLRCQNSAYEQYVKGEYRPDPVTAFIEGNFIHTYFEGLDAHEKYLEIPKVVEEVFNKPKKGQSRGEMCSRYRTILSACEAAEQDPFFSSFLVGRKEVILSAELNGRPWKIRCDVLNDEHLICTDIKGMATLGQSWNDEDGTLFYEKYGYWTRFSIYWKILKLATGKDYRMIMACLTKEENSERDIYEFDNLDRFEYELNKIEENMPEIDRIKKDGFGFKWCERCAICKKLKRPVIKKAISKITDFTIT